MSLKEQIHASRNADIVDTDTNVLVQFDVGTSRRGTTFLGTSCDIHIEFHISDALDCFL